VVQASLDSLSRWLGGVENLTVVWGSACFVAAREVMVKGEILSAPRLFINTGGRPTVPDWPGLSEVPYLTNRSMMAVDFLPDHLIVAGGSYIGLEFAQMYRRFGSRVTVLEYADRLIAREDAEGTVNLSAEACGGGCVTGMRRDDDACCSFLCRLPVPRRGDQLRGLAVLSISPEPGRGDAGGPRHRGESRDHPEMGTHVRSRNRQRHPPVSPGGCHLVMGDTI
jgi:hypothetical protein